MDDKLSGRLRILRDVAEAIGPMLIPVRPAMPQRWEGDDN